MIKQAIVPLAGLGTRLLPLTSVLPKELLPINGKPGLEYIPNLVFHLLVKALLVIHLSGVIILFLNQLMGQSLV